MKNVRIIESLAMKSTQYSRGNIYRVTDDQAAEWSRAGVAEITEDHPAYAADLFARLDDGAGKDCLFLPSVSEFGHTIMSHVRIVHFHKAARKVVCCKRGEEPLYPTADEFEYEWTDPVSDRDRVATLAHWRFDWTDLKRKHPGLHPVAAGALSRENEIYPVFPDVRIPVKAGKTKAKPDVVLGIRQRSNAPQRNWPHWARLAEALTAFGVRFAVIGDTNTVDAVPGAVAHSRGDIATAAALLARCKVFIGTDSGVSHLAAHIGVPMLVFRTDDGTRDLFPRMQDVNPHPVTVIANGWTHPDAVAEAAIAIASAKTDKAEAAEAAA